jgi:hemoglobin/transferrin/lactoferrin receptor protein
MQIILKKWKISDLWKCSKLFCTISLLLLTQYSFAQSIIIKDSKTKEAIPFVYVLRADTTKAVTADKNGNVDLSGYLKKEKIIFQHSAYEPLIGTKIRLVQEGVVYLVAKSNNLPSIEIKASLRNLGLQDDDPLPAEKIDLKDGDKLNPMNISQLIENSGSVSVQRSQGGGGSPVIRGFEANKILLVIDGVRMNNAIYRSGHLQNVITLDQAALDAAEIHFGPSSVLYGSDAIV